MITSHPTLILTSLQGPPVTPRSSSPHHKARFDGHRINFDEARAHKIRTWYLAKSGSEVVEKLDSHRALARKDYMGKIEARKSNQVSPAVAHYAVGAVVPSMTS